MSYAFVWLSGVGGFYNGRLVEAVAKDLGLGPLAPWATILLYFLFTGTISVIRGSATVLGEELSHGWTTMEFPTGIYAS